MTEQEFTKRYDQVNTWVNTMRPHWRHLNGNVHNDTDFWDQCIHSVPASTWTAWCEIYGDLKAGAPQSFDRHTHIYEDTVEVAKRIDLGKAITKPYDKTGRNKIVFRATMAIKDIIADISDCPFETKAAQIITKKAKPSQAEIQAQFNKMQSMLNDLFDTGE
jgi:hypothetical protein